MTKCSFQASYFYFCLQGTCSEPHRKNSFVISSAMLSGLLVVLGLERVLLNISQFQR
jgi:hypothetical protein